MFRNKSQKFVDFTRAHFKLDPASFEWDAVANLKSSSLILNSEHRILRLTEYSLVTLPEPPEGCILVQSPNNDISIVPSSDSAYRLLFWIIFLLNPSSPNALTTINSTKYLLIPASSEYGGDSNHGSPSRRGSPELSGDPGHGRKLHDDLLKRELLNIQRKLESETVVHGSHR